MIVNFSGSPIEMPWAAKAPAILQAWFLGSELGTAVADVIFGNVNPSGRLPITFPARIEDTPCFGNFPGENAVVKYAEGLGIGYRHYITNNIPTAFSFGHGLTYTEFTYRNLYADKWTLEPGVSSLSLNIDVVNVGGRIGSEVVQLYISPQNASLYRPKRELQAFEKVVDLAPGEEVTVTFEVDKYALSYYDDRECAWVLAAGTYDIEIGKSIEHIVLRHVLTVKETLKWTGV